MLLDQTQGTEMERLWNLLGELSSQLSHNRQQTEELHRRADELRSQAVHSQTGFTLRRFNVDLSKEEFESELERLNVSLVMENQALQQENRQLSSLLKDYESTLDAVMSKFRSYAHASQQHDLELTRHYESLLLSMPVVLPPPSSTTTSTIDPSTLVEVQSQAPPTLEPHQLSNSLHHLASLIRKALRSLQGEDPELDSTSPLLNPQVDLFDLFSERKDPEARSRTSSISSSTTDYSQFSTTSSLPNRHDPSSGGYISRHSTSSRLYIPTTSTSSLISSASENPSSSSSTPGSTPAMDEGRDPEEERIEQLKSRGIGPLDEALEREIEVESLRKENWELKRLLGIEKEIVDEEEEAQRRRRRAGEGAQENGEREDGRNERKTGGGGEGKKLFESGAKPERSSDEEDDDDQDDDDEDEDEDKDVELTKEDEALWAELFEEGKREGRSEFDGDREGGRGELEEEEEEDNEPVKVEDANEVEEEEK